MGRHKGRNDVKIVLTVLFIAIIVYLATRP
jgi:hypothetical protein